MSRRSHHPIRRHVRPRHPDAKRGALTPDRPDAVIDLPVEEAPAAAPETEAAPDAPIAPEPSTPDEPVDPPVEAPIDAEADEAPVIAPPPTQIRLAPVATPPVRPPVEPARLAAPDVRAAPPGPPGAATAPQLRRFIKSRTYIPMHELRRRFGIVVEDDDLAAIDLAGHRVFVGLPPREGALLGELLRAGDVGYEASYDPVAPVIVGVFPIRPVTRG